MRHRLAVLERLDRRERVVAVLDDGAILDFLERRLAQAEALDRLFDFLVGDLDLGLGHLEALVILDLDGRAQVEGRAELEREVFLQVGLFGDDFGRDDRLEVVLLERLFGVFLDELLNYLAADLFAEKSFEQIARRMAGAKALEHHAAFEFVVGAIQLMLDFVGLDFNRKFAPETVGFFDIYIHGGLNLTDKHTAIAGINRVRGKERGI